MTLNQIKDRLETIALSHKQIKAFRYGNPIPFLNGDLEYPACLVSVLPGNLSRSQKSVSLSFQIFICDLVNLSEDALNNELDVQSDLLSIAQDYMALLYSPEYRDWTVGEEVSFSIESEKFQDFVTAVILTVNISPRFDANRCQVPIN